MLVSRRVCDDHGAIKELSKDRSCCGVQVQVMYHEEIKCLKLAVHCGDNGLAKMSGRVAHP